MADRITVVTESRNLRTPQFTTDGDQLSTGKQWEEWLEGIEREFRFFKIMDPQDRKDALIIYGGKEIARLEKSLPDHDAGEEQQLNEYEKLREKLSSYYAPKKNKHYSRYIFLKMRPKHGETTTAYAARLRENANGCEFPNEDDRILEHIIQTTDNQSLIKKTINRKWSLNDMLQEVHQLEDTSIQVNDMKDNHGHRDVAKINRNADQERKYLSNSEIFQNGREQKKSCKYCGNYHSSRRREECRAYGKQCNKCLRWNHFAAVCKNARNQEMYAHDYRRDRQSKGDRNGSRRQPGRTRDIRRTADDEYRTTDDENSEYGNESSSDDEFFQNAVHHLNIRKIQIHKISDHSKTVPVMLNDVHVKVEPDSGADVNIMDEYQYRAYRHRTHEKTSLSESKAKLSTLQHSLAVKGEFTTTVRNRTRGVQAKFIVISGRINSPPLLGTTTLIDLGMLQIKVDGTLKEPNDLRMREDSIQLYNTQSITDVQEMEEHIAKGDQRYKRKWAENKQSSRDSQHKVKQGDTGFALQRKMKKRSTTYEIEPGVNGSNIATGRSRDGREIYRDAAHYNVAKHLPIRQCSDDWRERKLERTRARDARGDANQTDVPRCEQILTRRQMPQRNRRLPARYKN